ncbi:phosphoribosyltransferase family protein [Legionella sp. 16cNR16C]|uniref:phosphoribosyltransferase n=1 Tax=Legionella sp. 16cNR16C TaxID=2905656 RepID=UPI001E289CBB|nr:hypothetical protein [Legionella sp. 16cNR16C]
MTRQALMQKIEQTDNEIKAVTAELKRVHKITQDYANKVWEESPVAFTAEQIKVRAKELAAEIKEKHPQGTNPVLITLLDGGIPFARDVEDALNELGYIYTPATMQVSSYGNKTTGGKVNIIAESKVPLGGRHVIFLDDVCETAHTYLEVRKHLKKAGPESISLMVMVDKEQKEPRDENYSPEYAGFKARLLFLIGKGLDLFKRLRQTKEIRMVDPSKLDQEIMATIETEGPLNKQLQELIAQKGALELELSSFKEEQPSSPGTNRHGMYGATVPQPVAKKEESKDSQEEARNISYFS